MNNSFFLTLPSNSSMSHYPNNSLAEYTTRLHNEITLPDEWEVALVELQYQKTWYNIPTDESFTVLCAHCPVTDPPFTNERLAPVNYVKQIVIHAGYYETAEKLVEHINDSIQHAYSIPVSEWTDETKVEKKLYTIHKNVWPYFKYNKSNRKIYMTFFNHMHVKFSSTLAFILGLSEDQNPIITKGQDPNIKDKNDYRVNIKGKRAVDVNFLIHSMYVYCDLAENVHCGDTVAPLLRILPTDGVFGDTIYKEALHPRFIPLQKKQFQSIEINLRNDQGTLIPFNTGRVSVVLQLRKTADKYFV